MPPRATRSVDHQYLIRAAPDRVFQAISEPAWITQWLCDTAKLSLRKGGTYSFGWKNGPTHTGKIVEFVPGQRLALAWRWPGVELHRTIFSLSVEAKGDAALLRVAHTGFPGWRSGPISTAVPSGAGPILR